MMRANSLPFWIGGLVVPYWLLLYVFLFQDLYLTWHSTALLLKSLLPAAVIANVAGVFLGVVQWKQRKLQGSVAVAVNGLPFVAAACVVWWLFFGVKI